jgi:GWxTD domain-containing protein
LREYSELRAAPQRDDFIARFWTRRDPTPGTPENEFKNEFTRRVRFARERLADPDSAATPGFDTDRGRIYLMFGQPDAIEVQTVGNSVDEEWRYRAVAEMGGEFRVRFLPHRGPYCGYRILSPAPSLTGSPVPGRTDLPSVQLYPLGFTAISVPVDPDSVSGAGWDLYNSSRLQVDHSQIGFVDEKDSIDPLSRHLSSSWLEGGIGCTHALPADTYTLTTAVRSTTGQITRLNTMFRVQ